MSTYRVLKGQSDLLVGVNDEDRSDSEWDSLLVNIGKILLIEHILVARCTTQYANEKRTCARIPLTYR